MITRVSSFFSTTALRLLLPLVTAIISVALSGQASGYNLTGKSWPAGSNVVMQLSLGNAPLPMRDGNVNRNVAVAPALDAWNAQIGRMQFSSVMNSTAASATGDRVNSATFASNVFGQSFGSGTLAMTYYIMQGTSLTEADVVFNTAQAFDSYRGPLIFGTNGYAIGDMRRVFLHELGHAIGLNHSSVEAVMSATTSDREVLAQDDIAGAQAMYGAPSAPPPPAATPTPTPVATPAPTATPVPALSANRAKGELNADGHADLVWQNVQTGEHAIWFLRNGVYQSSGSLPTIAAEWKIAASADFNADGYGDCVWQNTRSGERVIWLLRDGAYQSQLALPSISPEWQIASAADLNADGFSDLVWQNTRSGERTVWFLRNGVPQSSAAVATIPTDWQIAGAADFNSDGYADFVWQNVRSGERVIWLLRDGVYQSSIALPSISPDWRIAAAADYNGDGYADFAWQNINTGERLVWILRNGIYQTGTTLPTIAPVWDICVH